MCSLKTVWALNNKISVSTLYQPALNEHVFLSFSIRMDPNTMKYISRKSLNYCLVSVVKVKQPMIRNAAPVFFYILVCTVDINEAVS